MKFEIITKNGIVIKTNIPENEISKYIFVDYEQELEEYLYYSGYNIGYTKEFLIRPFDNSYEKYIKDNKKHFVVLVKRIS